MASLKIIKNDSWLAPFTFVIANRFEKTKSKLNDIKKDKSSLSESINGHLYYGLHRHNTEWVIREWAPNATSVYLIGDFCDWKPQEEYKFNKLENGNWECTLPLGRLRHGMLYKLLIN